MKLYIALLAVAVMAIHSTLKETEPTEETRLHQAAYACMESGECTDTAESESLKSYAEHYSNMVTEIKNCIMDEVCAKRLR